MPLAMDEPCPKCGINPKHSECDGKGHIYVEDDTTRVCPNLLAKMVRNHLGPELSSVQHESDSPLFQMERGKPPTVDRTGDNLILTCPWINLLPHLKWALGCRWNTLSFKIVTDQQIKNVFVGNEQYLRRPPGLRDEGPVYNSLADFMGENYGLVIVKLGYIGHANKAAAGALKEGLLIRESLGLPTWLVHDPDHSWTHSYSFDVDEYVTSRFENLEISPADPGDAYQDPEDGLGLSFDDDDEPQEEPRQHDPDEEPLIENGGVLTDLDLPGENQPKKYRKNRGRW